MINLRFWIGMCITAGFIFLLLVSIDSYGLLDALSEANYVLLAPAVVLYFASLYFRAVRWRYLLKPFAPITASRLYPVVIVGLMVNNLLPMRVGEIARSYYLSTRENVRGTTGLVTVIVERVFDGLTLVFFLLAGSLFIPVTGLTELVSDALHIPPWGVITLAVTPLAASLLLMTMVSLRPARFISSISSLTRKLPERYRGAILRFVEHVLLGLDGIHRPERISKVFALSAPVWISEVIVYCIVALAFNLHNHLGVLMMPVVIMVVVAISNLSISIPSSPGAVGPFEFFTAMTLIFFGVGSNEAYAYAIVLHIGLMLPVIAVGLIHIASRSVSLRQLTNRGECESVAT